MDLFSGFQFTKLDPAQPYKPLDFGGGGINGSINRDGRIIAVNAYHSIHGYITLSSAPPFSENARYDAAAVRAYRRGMADSSGFGLTFGQAIMQRETWLIEDAIPLIRLTLADGHTAECMTFVTLHEPAMVIQFWEFSEPLTVLNFSGDARLMRCAYTQLTEGGPAAMPGNRSHLAGAASDDDVLLFNPALPAFAQLRGAGLSISVNDDGAIKLGSNTQTARATRSACLSIALDENKPPEALVNKTSTPDLARDVLAHWRSLRASVQVDAHPLRAAVWRGLTYSRNCCIPTGEEAVCIITDHMLLPLSWNRDGYYAACALLRSGDKSRRIVRGHLIWLFEHAERIHGLWGRSYLANGRVKDRGFQLDQQLYPLLELAEYVLETGDMAMYDRLKQYIHPLLDQLTAPTGDIKWLLPTDETPGDDPIALPYHLSSHILLWRTLKQLGHLPDMGSLTDDADELKGVVLAHFTTRQDESALLSYATDGKGHHHLYHDANDVPLVLAAHWGFTNADDPVWQNTLAFAFSDANTGGFYAGRLGSVHTPAAWPLGDIQDYIAANIIGDTERALRAVNQLQCAMQWDGALPEAYDPADFSVVSRHWFVWPNALLAWWELSKGST